MTSGQFGGTREFGKIMISWPHIKLSYVTPDNLKIDISPEGKPENHIQFGKSEQKSLFFIWFFISDYQIIPAKHPNSVQKKS